MSSNNNHSKHNRKMSSLIAINHDKNNSISQFFIHSINIDATKSHDNTNRINKHIDCDRSR